MNLLERRDATKRTLQWFAPRPFDWKAGATCVHLVRRHLEHMGYQPPPMPFFRSALSAKRALKAKGWGDLASMMDAHLPQIAPARMIMGDVVELPSEDEVFGALCVATGNGEVMGYFGGEKGFAVMQPIVPLLRAWRA